MRAPGSEATSGRIRRETLGRAPDGSTVEGLTIRNVHGAELRLMTFGAVLLALRVPDREGVLDDVILGFDTLDDYIGQSAYLGAVVGRYANRIAAGRFRLDGVEVQLTINDGVNHLHGGVSGFDKANWRITRVASDDRATSVELIHRSADGDQGYPGSLEVIVRYTFLDSCALLVEYEATTDRPTIVNLTQHSYFNLTGDPRSDVLDHQLTIFAEHFTPVDAGLIPLGDMAPVANTPFDFRDGRRIGDRIDQPHEQLRRAGGYDHNFVLARAPGDRASMRRVARLEEPTTGRVLDVHTTEPGLQFYSGNFLDGRLVGKHGIAYERRVGLCLETQHFPDSPNRPAFPTTVLRAGERYQSRTLYAFSMQAADGTDVSRLATAATTRGRNVQ